MPETENTVVKVAVCGCGGFRMVAASEHKFKPATNREFNALARDGFTVRESTLDEARKGPMCFGGCGKVPNPYDK